MTWFIPVFFATIFLGFAALGFSVNLFARKKRMVHLMAEEFLKSGSMKLPDFPVFPFILQLSSLAYAFSGVPSEEEAPEMYEHEEFVNQVNSIRSFQRTYLILVPVSFILLLILVVIAGLFS